MAKKSQFCALIVLSFHIMFNYHSVETIKLFWLFHRVVLRYFPCVDHLCLLIVEEQKADLAG